jgi:hypothetical protein
MSSTRRTAVVAGVFFVVAAFPAMMALALYQPVLNDASYVLGAGTDTRVLWGAFLEVLVAVSVVGTAVTLHPVLKRQNQGIALGYVCGRVLEATFIVVGILSLLSIVTLRQGSGGGAGTDDAALVAVSRALVALHDWTFLLGPGLFIGGNTLMLASLMYRSRLVPRPVAVLGLVSAPLVAASGLAVLFGAYDQLSTISALAAVPVFVWEMSLATYLIVKGFRPSPLLADDVRPAERTAVLAPA